MNDKSFGMKAIVNEDGILHMENGKSFDLHEFIGEDFDHSKYNTIDEYAEFKQACFNEFKKRNRVVRSNTVKESFNEIN